MDHVADRDVLTLDHAKRGVDGLADYRSRNNAASLDGLPGLRPPVTSRSGSGRTS
jgi:hypothetical protein